MMVANNTDKHRTAYTVTVDCKEGEFPTQGKPFAGLTKLAAGTTTGISAHDRALTARRLADPTSKADDFSKPGHLVPLRARDGGVLTRPGHTEAAVGELPFRASRLALIRCRSLSTNGSRARRHHLRAHQAR
jgi:3,4-dihydroxy-2-butanone 4-phosphate synthase